MSSGKAGDSWRRLDGSSLDLLIPDPPKGVVAQYIAWASCSAGPGQFVVALDAESAWAAGVRGAAALFIEPDPARLREAIRANLLRYAVNTLAEAVRLLRNALIEDRGLAVGLSGDPASVLAECDRRGICPDATVGSPRSESVAGLWIASLSGVTDRFAELDRALEQTKAMPASSAAWLRVHPAQRLSRFPLRFYPLLTVQQVSLEALQKSDFALYVEESDN